MPKGKLFLFAVKGRVEDSDSDETRSPKGGGQAKAEGERMTHMLAASSLGCRVTESCANPHLIHPIALSPRTRDSIGSTSVIIYHTSLHIVDEAYASWRSRLAKGGTQGFC